MPTLEALYIGRVGTLPDGSASAIAKAAVDGPVALTADGLAGDAQADRHHHGGPDQALLAYAVEHYPAWDARLRRRLTRPSFGENLAVGGRREEDVRIGELWRVGGALLRVVQPRVPCHKPAALTGEPRMTAWMGRFGATGYYLAVVEAAPLEAGPFEVVATPRDGVSVAELNRLRYQDRADVAGLERALDAPELHADWRALLAAQLRDARAVP
jgi:MOSC domain-containing protein YiiM